MLVISSILTNITNKIIAYLHVLNKLIDSSINSFTLSIYFCDIPVSPNMSLLFFQILDLVFHPQIK